MSENIIAEEQKSTFSFLPEKMVRPFLSVIGFLLIAGSLGSAFYFYHQYQITQNLIKNPNQVTAAEVKGLVGKVSKLIELPTETPQVATVVDQKKLADQPFFVHAVNGDRVLIFAKAREAILYRPSSNKIIEVSPLNLPSPSAQEQGNVAGVSTQVVKSPSPTVIHK